MNTNPTTTPTARYSRRMLLLWVVVSLALLSALTALIVVGPRHDPQRVLLPDGRTLELLGTTIGTNRFSNQKSWHQTVRRILPAPLQKWLPTPLAGVPCSAKSDSINIFLRVIEGPSKGINSRPPWHLSFVTDTTGLRYDYPLSLCGSTVSGTMVFSIGIEKLPGNPTKFRLHLTARDESELAAFNIRVNPPNSR